MLETREFSEKAKRIYEAHREEWEKLYDGKVIAIDIDVGDFASVGDQAQDVGLEARKERPGHHIFIRRVGKNPVVLRFRKKSYA
jgi:hypothetical protein